MLGASELLADFRLVSDLLENHPAVTFLAKDQAAVLHAVLTNTFDVDREQIPADTFEAEVASILSVLQDDGVRVPERAVRDVCRSWVDGKWLRLDPTTEGGQVYARTVTNYLMLLLKDGKPQLDLGDELTRGPLVTHQGKVVHDVAKATLAR